MLSDYYSKVKNWIIVNKTDLYIAAIIFLVGLGSFGLGRLSLLVPQKEPIWIEQPSAREAKTSAASSDQAAKASAAAVILSQGRYVASKNGTVYHYPWCSGAQRIKEENKIWFQTKEEAEGRGYRPAGNCEGL